ncbi:methyltransferase [Acidobacteria bacterium ACD]|nr:methyltransferase [Acidobacteria bacterium ACD]
MRGAVQAARDRGDLPVHRLLPGRDRREREGEPRDGPPPARDELLVPDAGLLLQAVPRNAAHRGGGAGRLPAPVDARRVGAVRLLRRRQPVGDEGARPPREALPVLPAPRVRPGASVEAAARGARPLEVRTRGLRLPGRAGHRPAPLPGAGPLVSVLGNAARWALQPLRRALLSRRVRRLVLEEVDGLPLVVLPDVLNPVVFRTGALLSRTAARRVAERSAARQGTRFLDLGCGTGVVALLSARAGAGGIASDVSPEAVRNARLNLLLNRLERRVEVREGDLFAPVEGERFDLVAFNPPFFRGKTKYSATTVRWCRFLRQGHKVDRPMKRTIRYEDTQTIYG